MRLTLPIQSINPVLKLMIAILAGVLFGLIGNLAISDALQASITNLIMVPIYDVWNRILNVLSGPVIFFMTITTVLNTRKIRDRGADSRALIDAMIFDIIFGLFASAANQAMLQLELVEQADKIGLLNRTLLQKAE